MNLPIQYKNTEPDVTEEIADLLETEDREGWTTEYIGEKHNNSIIEAYRRGQRSAK